MKPTPTSPVSVSTLEWVIALINHEISQLKPPDEDMESDAKKLVLLSLDKQLSTVVMFGLRVSSGLISEADWSNKFK